MVKKNLTIKDFTVIETPAYIKLEEVIKKLGKVEYRKFSKWIMGQTCPGIYNSDGELEISIYPLDLELYLNQRNRGKLNPISFD